MSVRARGAPASYIDAMITAGAEIATEHVSTWNRRFVVRLADGAEVESVLYRGDTLCISSQVGCAVRCPFCASGAEGLARSLETTEMIAQVLAVEQRGIVLRGVTVSGIGEPLHNAARVAEVIAWCHERGTPASLTTSGGPVARLGEYLREVPHHGLTISVHAGREAVRARLVPHGPALEPLFAAITSALPSISRRRRKRTALAYLLLAGENDDPEELDAFAERARPLELSVHLYAHNAVATSAMRGVTRAAYELAYSRLAARGLRVRMSSQARIEANGGCGTLVALRRDRASTGEPRSRWPRS